MQSCGGFPGHLRGMRDPKYKFDAKRYLKEFNSLRQKLSCRYRGRFETRRLLASIWTTITCFLATKSSYVLPGRPSLNSCIITMVCSWQRGLCRYLIVLWMMLRRPTVWLLTAVPLVSAGTRNIWRASDLWVLVTWLKRITVQQGLAYFAPDIYRPHLFLSHHMMRLSV